MERNRDDDGDGPRPGRRSSAPLLAVSAALAWLAVLLEVRARTVELSVVPARAEFLVLVLLVGLLAVAVGLLGATRRSSAGGDRSVVVVLVALVATVAVLVARVVVAPWQPTVSVLSPLVLVAPVALTWELAQRLRVGGWRWWPVERGLRLWCTIGWVVGVAAALQPARWGSSGPQTAEFVGTWASIAAAAAAAAVGAALARRPVAWSFAVLGVASSVALLVARSATVSSVPGSLWLVLGAALLALAGTWAPRDDRGRMLVGGRALVDTVSGGARLAGSGAVRVGSGLAAAGSTGGSTLARAGARWWRRSSHWLADLVAPRSVPARPVPQRSDLLLAAVGALGSLVYVVAAARWALSVGWQPTGHAATLMARASQVGTADHPWIGLVTSLGGAGSGAAHPGPLPMDVLAPFVRLFGVGTGAIVGGATVTLLCWLTGTWAAWRAAGRSAAVSAWVASALVIAVPGLGAVWEANNISVSLLAVFTTVLVCWAVASGAWSAWWAAVALASFCAQSYIPHALVVVGPLVVAGAALLVVRRRSDDPGERRRLARAWWIGVGVGVLAWAQPLWEAVSGGGGNVRALLTEVTTPVPSLGPVGTVRAVAWMFAVPPRWGEVTESYAQAGGALDFVGGSVVVGLLVAVLLSVAAWRTRSTTPAALRQLQLVTGVLVVSAALNATQLPLSYLRSFQLGWLVVASIVVWFTVALRLGVAALIALRRVGGVPVVRVARFAGASLAVVAVFVLGVTGPDSIEQMKGGQFAIDPMIEPVVDQTVDAVGTDRPVLALRAGTRLNEVATDTVVSNLIARGVDVRVEPGLGGFNYGQRRLVGSWSGPTLWVLGGVEPVQPSGRLVARAEVPGWSDERFEELAELVAAGAAGGPPVVLQPWVRPYLVRYLSGWVPPDRVCALAADLLAGRTSVASLPPGLVLTLYGDLAIESPALPAAVQAEASALLGRAPIEVWLTDQPEDGAVSSDLLLRDGTQCPPDTVGP